MREEAVAAIQQERGSQTEGQQHGKNTLNNNNMGNNYRIRNFKLSLIADREASLGNMLRANEPLLEPLLIREMAQADLHSAARRAPMRCPNPCHSQGMERTVRVVSDAAQHVCGADRRDGVIREQQRSRQEMPRPHSRKDFFRN